MTRRLRAARLGVIRSYALAEGALRVYAYGTDEARAISAHLIQLGYDAAATGDRVTVTLPEPVEEPAPVITYRKVGEALYEVVRDGQAIGRVARTTPAHVRLSGARWASYTTTGERVASGSYTRDDACDALLAVLADRAREEQPAPIVTVEQLVADTLRLGYRTVREYVEAPGREVGQVTPWTLDRAERVFAREGEAQPAPDYANLGGHTLARLARRGDTAAKAEQRWRANRVFGMVEPRPATSTPAEPVEADLPPTEEDRVTVRIRARELRRGDLVVDSLGEHKYAAFDVQLVDGLADTVPVVRVWTAIRDQERGLPPVLTVPAERELLVLRPMSEEGRELAARAGWVDGPAFGSPRDTPARRPLPNGLPVYK